MEEELNEHDLEDRLYAMLHHVDETPNNVNQIDATQLIENGPRGTIRRYWRTSVESNPHTKVNTPNPHVKVNTYNPYVKFNAPKPSAPLVNNTTPTTDNTKPKEESESPTPPVSVDLSIFQSPIPQNVKKVIEIIEHENNNQVILESSDEDEVVEVALPPKPTITIESSDDDELSIIKPDSATKTPSKQDKSKKTDRAISASPVPSVVSSISDDFIRGDCIALNISSHKPDNPSFDFSLHGPDLIIQDTPSKKKRKRKNKEAVTSTPIVAEKPANQSEECFATPKSKAKNKKKAKTSTVIQKSIPVPDNDDSDSNQSIIDITRGKNTYVVTEKSLPSADVYESDSNQSEVQVPSKDKEQQHTISSDSGKEKDTDNLNKTTESELFHTCDSIVDLTENDNFITIDNTGITESIVMANVTGFTESEDYDDENRSPEMDNISKYVSSKIPSILNADLDFDNLKRNEKVCKKRRYSLTTLRAEMEKFYNESWGGEDFNHREIQKNMSRDKNLWAIDPKDRMPSYGQRKIRCNYCNRVGHRDDACMRKPAVCYMCGNSGHYESRCPSKICVNCGSPNHMFTNICRNCSSWEHITCAECSQSGHPSSHCPDLWRRYHNTIDINMPLERCYHTKQWSELYCSGCSRRGHLIHTCRITVPFANHPINTPYVCVYRSLYYSRNQENKQLSNKNSQDSTISSATTPNRGEGNKRLSKSPTTHEHHLNKKRNLSVGDEVKIDQAKSPAANISRQNPPLKEVSGDGDKTTEVSKAATDTMKEIVSGKAPDFIPIGSSNHDNKGHVIQDNEVSDTSEVVTSARIYVTNEVFDKLKTKDHQDWLKATAKKLDILVQCCGGAFPFLSVKGKVGDQESFQYLLRERKWEHDVPQDKASKLNNDGNVSQTSAVESVLTHTNLPKNRYNLLRHLTKALNSLKEDLGDPKAMHKELTYLQNRHEKLLKQKVINPTILSHSRTNINNMLKKLNTILLGQAGLATGSSSVTELHSYIEKLSTQRGNTVPMELRREIGRHFHSIFSASARDDYSELLKKYDHTKPMSIKTVNLISKNISKMKNKPLISSPKIKKITSIPSQQDNPQNTGPGPNNSQKSIQMKKLMFYQQRLKNVKPKEPANKKTRMELIRKVHTFIASMFQKEKLSSKTLKKVKKAQEEARIFLSANV